MPSRKFGFARQRTRLRDTRKPRRRRLVLVAVEVGLAQLQHGQGVVGIRVSRRHGSNGSSAAGWWRGCRECSSRRHRGGWAGKLATNCSRVIVGTRSATAAEAATPASSAGRSGSPADRCCAPAGYRCSFFMSSNCALALKVLPSKVVAAHDHVVGVHLLGDAIDGRPRGQNRGRHAGMVKGVFSVVAAHDVNPGRRHALRQDFGKRLADPLQPGALDWFSNGMTISVCVPGNRLPGRHAADQERGATTARQRIEDMQIKLLQSNSIIDVRFFYLHVQELEQDMELGVIRLAAPDSGKIEGHEQNTRETFFRISESKPE